MDGNLSGKTANIVIEIHNLDTHRYQLQVLFAERICMS